MLFEFFERLFQLYFCNIQVVLHSSTAPFSSSSSSLIVPCSLFSSSLLHSAFCIAFCSAPFAFLFTFPPSTSMQTVWPFPQGSFFSSPFCSALFQISFAAQFQSPFLYTNQQLIHSFADQGMSSPPLASIPPSLPAAQSSYSRVSPLFSFLSPSPFMSFHLFCLVVGCEALQA